MNTSALEHAILCLKQRDYENLSILLPGLFEAAPDLPQYHLMLGIYHELSHRDAMAMRHYRAALALDGTYTPALNNLYRLGDGKHAPIDYGDGKGKPWNL